MQNHFTPTMLQSAIEYLNSESIAYNQKVIDTIYISNYDKSLVPADITLYYSNSLSLLSISVDASFVIDSLHRVEVLEFLNFVNSGLAKGNFHICPTCTRVTYHYSFHISDIAWEKEEWEATFDRSIQTYKLIGDIVEDLVNASITIDDAKTKSGIENMH